MSHARPVNRAMDRLLDAHGFRRSREILEGVLVQFGTTSRHDLSYPDACRAAALLEGHVARGREARGEVPTTVVGRVLQRMRAGVGR